MFLVIRGGGGDGSGGVASSCTEAGPVHQPGQRPERLAWVKRAVPSCPAPFEAVEISSILLRGPLPHTTPQDIDSAPGEAGGRLPSLHPTVRPDI